MNALQHYPDDSRIWVFTSNRKISADEQGEIGTELRGFLDKWAAHGTPLMADYLWLNEYQVAIVLDQSQAGASGCSIDTQTRFMRKLGDERNIDWFDRMHLILEDESGVRRISFFDLGEHPEAKLFDNLVQQLKELRSNWPIPMRESRYAHLMR